MGQRVRLEYGDDHLDVDLPDHAIVVRAGVAAHEPAGLADPVGVTRSALRDPLGAAPLRELVGPGARVTIAVPDRVKGGTHATAHRKVTVPLLLAELDAAGVRPADVTVVCAIGLHRKNTRAELGDYLGEEVLGQFGPDQLVNHDAEDPDGIVDLADSDLGDVVQANRRLVESDLSIMVSHAAGNPYGGFSGGYKMPATGLTTWRSIRSHHTPRSLHRPDFVPISPHSRFRDQLRSIGERMESAAPQPFFTVDAVLNARSEQVAVLAGRIPDVEQATWPPATRRVDLEIPGEPAQVLLVGIPRDFHYGKGMGSNPLLLMQAVAAALTRAAGALVEHPVVIATAVCDGWFNDAEFPSYAATYAALAECADVTELAAAEDRLCTDPDYVAAYRDRYAYHPFHAFSMAYFGGLVRERAGAVYVAGAMSPGHARGMGAIPTRTVDQALAHARRHVGADPRMIVIPELSKPGYHLHTT